MQPKMGEKAEKLHTNSKTPCSKVSIFERPGHRSGIPPQILNPSHAIPAFNIQYLMP
jgi:hypothetical protein